MNVDTNGISTKPRRTATIVRQRVTDLEVTHCSTREFAGFFRVKPASVRRALCIGGAYQGIVPIKLDTGRLLWPLAQVKKALEG